MECFNVGVDRLYAEIDIQSQSNRKTSSRMYGDLIVPEKLLDWMRWKWLQHLLMTRI